MTEQNGGEYVDSVLSQTGSGRISAFEGASTALLYVQPQGALVLNLQYAAYPFASPTLIAVDSGAQLIRQTALQINVGPSAAVPGGGLVFVSNDGTDWTLNWFEASGNLRWSFPFTGGMPMALGVDAQQRLLVLYDAQGTPKGVWFDADGHAGTPFSGFALGEFGELLLTPRIGGGLFLFRANVLSQPPSVAMDWPLQFSPEHGAETAPSWLRNLPYNQVQIVESGKAYAVLQFSLGSGAPGSVGLYSPSGRACGSVPVPKRDDATAAMSIGLDGTLFQGSNACGGTGHCRCTLEWWSKVFPN